eukprot:5082555-Pyramimonas_sp.AAC.1
MNGLSQINYRVTTAIIRKAERMAALGNDEGKHDEGKPQRLLEPENVLHGKKDVAMPMLARAE